MSIGVALATGGVTIRTALGVAIAGVLVYAAFEARFWKTPSGRSIVSPRQRRLRTAGLILLLLGLAFWFRGTYISVPHFAPGTHTRAAREEALRYVGYWTFTFCLMLPLIPLAILDTRESLRSASRERAEVLAERMRLEQQLPGGEDQS